MINSLSYSLFHSPLHSVIQSHLHLQTVISHSNTLFCRFPSPFFFHIYFFCLACSLLFLLRLFLSCFVIFSNFSLFCLHYPLFLPLLGSLRILLFFRDRHASKYLPTVNRQYPWICPNLILISGWSRIPWVNSPMQLIQKDNYVIPIRRCYYLIL